MKRESSTLVSRRVRRVRGRGNLQHWFPEASAGYEEEGIFNVGFLKGQQGMRKRESSMLVSGRVRRV